MTWYHWYGYVTNQVNALVVFIPHYYDTNIKKTQGLIIHSARSQVMHKNPFQASR